MTLVIRTDELITTPTPNSKALPDLGVGGVIGRFHADSLVGQDGTPVAGWPDASGSGNHLDRFEGAAVTATEVSVSGKRGVNLVGGGRIRGGTLPNFPESFTIALRIHVAANPTGSQVIAGTRISTAGILAFSWGGFGCFSDTIGAQGAAVPKPAWVTLVATFGEAGGTGKIVTDGVAVSGPQTWGSTSERMLMLSGTTHAAGVTFRQAVFLDHAASPEEITSLTAALTAD